MSGQSSVGTGSVYEAGDQRNIKDSEARTADRYNEGVSNSHKPNDSSMSSRPREEKRKDGDGLSKEAKQAKEDPTLPARSHGNEPSKGAKIDAELQAEEEEMLKKKGAK
ncbi:MAG: hypothetical protein LQ340_004938 [Diploschistes diacapsis]|nr:MAG: hypothetical protein LQ340_004938 [Diploschistes diacapsis]